MKNMKTRFWLFPILFIVLFFSGCAGSVADLVQLPTGEIVSAATDRFGSWERVETARSSERKSVNDLEKAKLENQAKEPQVQISIKTVDELEAYERIRMNENMAATTKAMGDIALALARGDNPYPNAIPVTPFPKGVFAEGFESLGKGIKDAGNTPATMILSTGHALGSFMSKVDQGARVDSGGGDVSLVNEKTIIEANGESAVTNQPKQDNSTINPEPEEVEVQ